MDALICDSRRKGSLTGEQVVVRQSQSGGAVFDPTDRHRYLLWRNLADTECGDSTVCFIMLNPNRADELSNDPTIKRCIGFAKGWGFHKILVVNLFSIKASTPALLRQMKAPLVGPSNDSIVVSAIEQSSMVVAAWGNHGSIGGRDQELLSLIEPFVKSNTASPRGASSIPVPTPVPNPAPNPATSNSQYRGLYCLGLTKLRQPKHPLYLRATLEPVRFLNLVGP